MKRLIACVALLPAVALAAGPDDFAWQWPLALQRADAGAYRVVLDEDVYLHARDASLRDVAVLDRDGRRVPAALEAAAASAPRPVAVPVPWFALPAPDGTAPAGGWSLRTEAAADGRLRRVDVRSDAAAPTPPVPRALLLDLAGLSAPAAFIDLQWRPAGPLDLGVRVEGSDDLEQWASVDSRGRLVDLRQDGRRLVQRRIELIDAPRVRYLRLIAARAPLPAIASVGVAAQPAHVAPAPAWRQLSPVGSVADGRTFEYVLNGRFPVTGADVALPGAHAVRWRLSSRDATDARWRARVADWLGYRVADGDRSAPRAFPGAVRDRHWRLQAGASVAATPRLRLGWRPEALVFVAQGPGPYTLVAGSARPPANDDSGRVIDALRAAQRPGWQPAPASLGAGRERAGAAALRPPRDWRAGLLWGVLVLGTALVGGFALHVLRTARPLRD